MNKRAQIIDKVKALRARAGDAASSPAEVEAAAQRAAKLIAEHELTEADLREASADEIHTDSFDRGRMTPPIHLERCAYSIARLSETRGLWRGGELLFVGFPEDVQFALYLTELVSGAAKRAWSTYSSARSFWSDRSHQRAARRDFLTAFGDEVASVFHAAANDRNARRREAQATGTDLVVLKHQIIADHIAANIPTIRDARREGKKRRAPNLAAMVAGARAGRQINPGRPLQDATCDPDAIL